MKYLKQILKQLVMAPVQVPESKRKAFVMNTDLLRINRQLKK